jgi:hypothetical protein
MCVSVLRLLILELPMPELSALAQKGRWVADTSTGWSTYSATEALLAVGVADVSFSVLAVGDGVGACLSHTLTPWALAHSCCRHCSLAPEIDDGEGCSRCYRAMRHCGHQNDPGGGAVRGPFAAGS